MVAHFVVPQARFPQERQARISFTVVGRGCEDNDSTYCKRISRLHHKGLVFGLLGFFMIAVFIFDQLRWWFIGVRFSPNASKL